MPTAKQCQPTSKKANSGSEKRARIAAGDNAAKKIFERRDTDVLQEEILRLKNELEKSRKEAERSKKEVEQSKKEVEQSKKEVKQSKKEVQMLRKGTEVEQSKQDSVCNLTEYLLRWIYALYRLLLVQLVPLIAVMMNLVPSHHTN